jgi:hypothetical protein
MRSDNRRSLPELDRRRVRIGCQSLSNQFHRFLVHLIVSQATVPCNKKSAGEGSREGQTYFKALIVEVADIALAITFALSTSM